MEMFGLPLGEIREQFTFSEMVLLGWRSQEQSYHMKKKMGTSNGKTRHENKEESVEVPAGIPEKYYNEDGEVDHRKMTLKESIAYMDAIGIHLPRPAGTRPGVVRAIEEQPSMDDLFGKD